MGVAGAAGAAGAAAGPASAVRTATLRRRSCQPRKYSPLAYSRCCCRTLEQRPMAEDEAAAAAAAAAGGDKKKKVQGPNETAHRAKMDAITEEIQKLEAEMVGWLHAFFATDRKTDR